MKKYYNKIALFMAIMQFWFLLSGNLPLFMISFTIGALWFAMTSKSHIRLNGLCVTTCELSDISYDTACNIKGGLKAAYWAKISDVDWAAIAANPLLFDTTTQKLLGYTMLGGAVFHKLTFDRKQGFYNFTYTSDTDVYAQLITMIFEGKSITNRNNLVKAVSCCNLLIHLIDNNCQERIVGIEWNGTSFEPQISKLKITRHLDASGQFGTDKARDELDLGGESLTAPLYANVGETNIPI